MPQLYEVCSKCGNNWMACNCENFHPPITTLVLSPGEIVLSRDEVNQIRQALSSSINSKHYLGIELRNKIWPH